MKICNNTFTAYVLQSLATTKYATDNFDSRKEVLTVNR